MNLAPVCDLPRSLSDYIADRAFGTDVDEVTEAVRNAVAGYCDNSLICTLKHFPGYGNNLDTHTGISLDSRPMSELQKLDLRPFTAGMEQGAPVVMVSHNIVECVNADLPGSLSPEMYALVRSLGFDGVIMTDDLSMQAVGEYCGENKAAVTAFLAGADLLCSSDYENAASALAAAVNSGEISQERLDQSVLRILRMKIKYGVIPTEVG
ncbi:beta-N-acetylhexosaminidase [Eubacterium sp. CAG:786]|nr:beta-N-acetylhexosaminidase [Eubacterium sp. CAG:786]